ncbi:MAG: hypothetical protein HEEMFOPI_01645 [Holosporales bacterium]
MCYCSSTFSTKDWRIGFEFELPNIGISKILGPLGGKTRETINSKKIIIKGSRWIMTGDTLDSRVSNAGNEVPGIWNLEFKSIGNGFGLDEVEIMDQAIQEIQMIIETMFQSTEQNSISFDNHSFNVKTFDVDNLQKLLNVKADTSMNKKQIEIVFKENDEKLMRVRPQLTFQLPLSKIAYLFRHLHILKGNPRITSFFHPITQENNLRILNNVGEINDMSAAQGLVMLFSFYVEQFFSEHGTDEPGPKTSFPVMSRITFRDMYEHLPKDQKELFFKDITKRYHRFFPSFNSRIKPFERIKKHRSDFVTKIEKERRNIGTDTSLLDLLILPSAEDVEKAFRDDIHKLFNKEAVFFNIKNKITYAIDRYTNGNPELVSIYLSLEDVLNSIVENDFSVDFSDVNSKYTVSRKKTDYFSTPFPGLDANYSMGLLSYPAIFWPQIKAILRDLLYTVTCGCTGKLRSLNQKFSNLEDQTADFTSMLGEGLVSDSVFLKILTLQ